MRIDSLGREERRRGVISGTTDTGQSSFQGSGCVEIERYHHQRGYAAVSSCMGLPPAGRESNVFKGSESSARSTRGGAAENGTATQGGRGGVNSEGSGCPRARPEGPWSGSPERRGQLKRSGGGRRTPGARRAPAGRGPGQLLQGVGHPLVA